jgi:hypothetical protein
MARRISKTLANTANAAHPKCITSYATLSPASAARATYAHPSASTILTAVGFFIAFPDLDVIATISNAEQGSEVAALVEDSWGNPSLCFTRFLATLQFIRKAQHAFDPAVVADIHQNIPPRTVLRQIDQCTLPHALENLGIIPKV